MTTAAGAILHTIEKCNPPNGETNTAFWPKGKGEIVASGDVYRIYCLHRVPTLHPPKPATVGIEIT